MQIDLDNAIAENFLQYQQLSIPLRNQGLVFLGGEMEYDQSRSNGTGKTSCLSLVPWVIWGRLLRDMHDVSRVINYEAKSCYGRVEGTLGDNKFWIERSRTRKGEPEIKTSFAGSSRSLNIQDEINQIFGTFELAQNTVFLIQRKALEFMTAGNAGRRQIMEDLLKIDKWNRHHEAVKSDIMWANTTLTGLRSDLAMAEIGLDALLAKIETSHKLATLDLDAQCRLLNTQLGVAELGHKQLQVRYTALRKAHLEVSDRLKESRIITDRLSRLTADKRCTLIRLSTTLENLKTSIAQLQTGVCPTCHRPLVKDFAVDQKTQEILCDQIATVSAEVTQSTMEYEAALASTTTIQGEEHKTSAKIQEVTHRLTESKKILSNVKFNISEIEDQIRCVSQETDTDHRKEVHEYQRVITTRRNAIAELEHGVRFMELCKEGFSYRGIPSLLISNSLPLLVQETNKNLSTLSDDELSINILPADISSDGKILERLTFLVSKNGHTAYLNDYSDGEQRRGIIALFLGLLSIRSLLTGVKWMSCFIDELFDGLDAPGVERAIRVLRNIPHVNTTIITSHRSELAALGGFSKVWSVRCHNGKSQLVC
mgnify:CR=1 FL=1